MCKILYLSSFYPLGVIDYGEGVATDSCNLEIRTAGGISLVSLNCTSRPCRFALWKTRKLRSMLRILRLGCRPIIVCYPLDLLGIVRRVLQRGEAETFPCCRGQLVAPWAMF